MNEARTTEIAVGTPAPEWSEELVAQWNALADTVTRTVQQNRNLHREEEQRERTAQDQELRRLRAALAGSEQRALAATQEAGERMEALQRHYDLQVASLQRQLEEREPAAEDTYAPVDTQPQRAATSVSEERVFAFARSEWERESSSPLARLGAGLSRLRSGPLFLPATGFLSGLLVMVLVYPLVRRAPVRAANSNLTGTSMQTAGRNAATPATSLPNPILSSAPRPAPSSLETNDAASNTGKPRVAADELANRAIRDGYAVVLAGGKTLTAKQPGEPSAEYEARLAIHAGYTRTAVYQKNGRYMAVVLFSTEDQAREGIRAINDPYSGRWKRTSSVVAVEQWCRNRKTLDPVVINGANVAVWSCSKDPG